MTGQSVRSSLISLITLTGLINHSDHSDNSSLGDEAADLIADNVLAKHSGEKQDRSINIACYPKEEANGQTNMIGKGMILIRTINRLQQ